MPATLNDQLTVYRQVGLRAAAAPASSTEPTTMPVVQTQQRSFNAHGLLNVDNPVFWFGVILAVSLGLIGFSTHFRVGKEEASVELERVK